MARTRRHASHCSPGCAVEATLRLIDGKWKGVILYHLLDGTLRFTEIRRRLASVTQRMLTNQLRELEADGLIARKVYAVVPPKVEYSLTERGRSLEPILTALKTWGDRHAAPPEPAQAA
jgi:DNA-binding HxlR family transcriptional regulator